jgi:hypothetical protein
LTVTAISHIAYHRFMLNIVMTRVITSLADVVIDNALRRHTTSGELENLR